MQGYPPPPLCNLQSGGEATSVKKRCLWVCRKWIPRQKEERAALWSLHAGGIVKMPAVARKVQCDSRASWKSRGKNFSTPCMFVLRIILSFTVINSKKTCYWTKASHSQICILKRQQAVVCTVNLENRNIPPKHTNIPYLLKIQTLKIWIASPPKHINSPSKFLMFIIS